MTEYMKEKFSVHAPGTQQYRDNYDAIFGNKDIPDAAPTTPYIKPRKTPVQKAYDVLFEEIDELNRASSSSPYGDLYLDDVKSYTDAVLGDVLTALGYVPDHVREFHTKFDLPIGDSPKQPDDKQVRYRLRLITEEYIELLESTGAVSPVLKDMLVAFCDAFDSKTVPYDKVDMVEFADALADLDFVIEGARLGFGIDGAPIANEVHRSNLSKVFPDGSIRKNELGKVIKPETYSAADVLGELQKQGYSP